MRNKLLLPLIIIGCLSASGQPTPPHALPAWLPDTAFIYNTDGAVSGFYEYLYDQQGRRTEIRFHSAINGQWEEQQRRTYTYDQRSNLLCDLVQNLENGQWKNITRNLYAYDAQDNRTLEHYQTWSDSLGRWTSPHIFHYTYDQRGNVDTFFREDDDSDYIARIFYRHNANGDVTLEQWQFWDTAWTDIFRATSTYDSHGRLLDYLEENWNHTHGGPPKLEWENWLHYLYSYDSAGNRSELQTWTWECGEEKWTNEFHYYYSYDSDNRLSTTTLYVWKRGTSEWAKREFTSNEYDPKGQLARSILQTPYNKEWVNHRLREYSYDQTGRKSQETEAFWNMEGQQWDNNSKSTWKFDRWGNQLENVFYNWESQKKQWVGVYRTTNSYTGEGNGDTCRYEMYDSRKGWYPFENTLYVPYLNNMEQLGGFLTSKVVVHYSIIGTDAITRHTETDLQCYPNPAQDFIRIRIDGATLLHCQLWDASGRIIAESRPCSGETTLSLSNLPKGAYILRCQTSSETIIRTVLKQ